jgi:hypothetical protein
MGDHLLIREFITVSALNNSVEQEDGAKGFSLDNSDILQKLRKMRYVDEFNYLRS